MLALHRKSIMSMMKRWYGIAMQSTREALAESYLRRQGLNVWKTRGKRIDHHARRRCEKLADFFPGYMFRRMDLNPERRRSVNGAADLVIGNAVRAVSGSLAETVDKLACLYGVERADILHQMMREEVAVTLNTRDLAPAIA